MPHHLIRHAHAVPDEENPARPLSAWGRKQVADLCAKLKAEASFQPAEFWHSPLMRSRETAMLLAAGLGLSARCVEREGLEPEDDPQGVARALMAEQRAIAVVGHQPHLGVLAGLLVAGGHGGESFAFPKAGVMALHRDGLQWRAEWISRSR